MEKTQSNRNDVYESTVAIDGWVIENISFFRNNWNQRTQAGSSLISVHTRHDEPDVIGYTTEPHVTYDADDCLFFIYYYDNRINIGMTNKSIIELDNIAELDLASPFFFDHLEGIIWNIRLIDYIQADLTAIQKNLNHISLKILDKRDDAFKRIGLLRKLHEFTGEVGAKTREYTERILKDPKEVAWPIVNGQTIKQPHSHSSDEWDVIPF